MLELSDVLNSLVFSNCWIKCDIIPQIPFYVKYEYEFNIFLFDLIALSIVYIFSVVLFDIKYFECFSLFQFHIWK